MVERYQKVSRIGRGTFGEAWLVTSTCSGRKYVVKEVRVEDMSKSEVQKANTEALILARCKHNNIVRYKEVFMVSNPATLCLVMEYADGGDLSCRVRQARDADEHVPEATVLKWFVQIIFAVQYLHSNDILHRDLKTQNIFLTKSDLVKVGDFGIARVLTSREDLATTAIGTPYYLSPEICRRLPYNHKSDMWAIGCVLYELCSLNHPFIADTFPDLVLRILRGAYRQLPPQYSSFVRDLVAVMLRTDPNRRPTADQVLMVPLLRPFVTAYLRQHEELISTTPVPPSSEMALSSPAKKKTDQVEDNGHPTQAPGRTNNLREAILKRLPFPRPRSASDSCVEAASRRLGLDFPPSGIGSSGSNEEISSTGSNPGHSADGSTTGRRHSHVLCHKVPLAALSCCSECKTEDNGDVSPCNCLSSSHSSGFSTDGEASSDKKSTCSSLHSNLMCSCAEEVSCTCTKGAQITCEVDLVFEGENVKNVPMKNEIMEISSSNSVGLDCNANNQNLIDI